MTHANIPESTVAKADPVATTLLQMARAEASREGIRVVDALRSTLLAHPRVSRVGFKHAAIAAGINWRTARNVYDRVTRA